MKRFLFFALIAFGFATANSITLDDIKNNLRDHNCISGHVEYEIYLPSAANPVVYNIDFTALPVSNDSLSECNYLIDWNLPRGNKILTGFNSYNNGNHFRYRDTRLQEYHRDEDILPFTAEGGGVARNAQFTEILPPFVAEKLNSIQTDTTYRYEFDPKEGALSGVRNISGYDALEFTYNFDKATGLPVSFDFVYNPASISEQIVSIKFSNLTIDGQCPELTETYLIGKYPDVFGKFRTSNFRAENLKGTYLPTISYKNKEGMRKSHTKGEKDLDSPLLIVFVSENVNVSMNFIETLRASVQGLPGQISTIYAFADNKAPEGFTAEAMEFICSNPQSLILSCGISNFPTLLLVDTEGSVNDVIIGMDNNIADTLSQELMLLQ